MNRSTLLEPMLILPPSVPHETQQRPELRVWDAKTMSPKPVASVKLPARVPLGFHAIHVTEADLATQTKRD